MLKIYLLFLVLIFFLANSVAFAAMDDSIADKPRLVSQEDKIMVDNQVMVVADLSNGQERDQNFAYIVQIRDENDVVISLSWLTGSLSPRQTFSPALSWIPTSPGIYSIDIFVWESINNAEALSPRLLLVVEAVGNLT